MATFTLEIADPLLLAALKKEREYHNLANKCAVTSDAAYIQWFVQNRLRAAALEFLPDDFAKKLAAENEALRAQLEEQIALQNQGGE